jgi:hypothetical protein
LLVAVRVAVLLLAQETFVLVVVAVLVDYFTVQQK